MVNKNNVIIKLKELNNKSRKGLYYYIKTKGKKPTYLKYNSNFNIDSYIEYYNDVFVKKDKTKAKKIKTYQKAYTKTFTKKDIKKYPKIYKKANKYLSKIKKQKSINQIIEKGISKIELYNINNISNNLLLQKIKQLLKPLVKDEELLNILATEENISKLRNRIETIVEFQDKNNQMLALTKKIGWTPKESIAKLKNLGVYGERIDPKDPYGDFNTLIILKEFNTPKTFKEGIISNIKVSFVFRKGK